MSEPKYVQPVIGRRSLGLLTLMLLGTLALWVDYYLRDGKSDTPQVQTYSHCLLGLVWGWTSASCWIASAMELRYLRWGSMAVIAAVFSIALQTLSEGLYIRYFSGLGGLILFQTLAYHLLRVPRWRKRALGKDEVVVRTAQFGIGEIIAATTCIAVLFSIAIRYRGEGIDPVSYWLTLTAFWCLAPLMSASMIFAVLSQRGPRAAAGLVLLSLLFTAGCAAGLTTAQLWLADLSWATWGAREMAFTIGTAYITVLIAYLTVPAVAGIVGRWQESDQAFSPPNE